MIEPGTIGISLTKPMTIKQCRSQSSFIFAILLIVILPILAACDGSEQQVTSSTGAPTTIMASPVVESTKVPEVTAVSQTGGKPRNILRIHNWNFPTTLDPQASAFADEIGVEVLNYEGLTRFDKDLKTVPAAAEKWEKNQDATEFTFTLRDGLKYSDGSPLTSRDFAAAIKRSLDPRGNVGGYQSTFFMIKGAEAIINTAVPTDETRLPGLFNALGIETPDDKTIKFNLTRPTPYLPTLTALWVVFPAKDDLVRKSGGTWWENSLNQIGNGPFQITTIDRAHELIEFKANENYWQGRPQLDGVQFRYIGDPTTALQAYKDGEIDIIRPDANDIPAIQRDPVLREEYKEYPGSCTTVLAFNLKKAPFNNQKVREAFAFAFDRERYIRDVRKGDHIKTLTWIPPGYPGYDPQEKRYDFDPAKAKQTLADAGYPDGHGFPEVKLTYADNNPASRDRAEYLAQLFRKSLGVTVILDPIDIKTLRVYREKNQTYPQMFNGESWCADYPDQQNWISIYWHSLSGFSRIFGYKNNQVDKLMDLADVEVDSNKRAHIYDQAQKLIVGDVPVVIWGNIKNNYLIKPYVKGLDFTPQDPVFPGQQTSLLDVTLDR